MPTSFWPCSRWSTCQLDRGDFLDPPAATFLKAGDYDNSKLYALVVMHMAFVVSALMLTYIDNIGSDKKAAGGH